MSSLYDIRERFESIVVEDELWLQRDENRAVAIVQLADDVVPV